MANKILGMNTIRKVLQQLERGKSHRSIYKEIGVHRNATKSYCLILTEEKMSYTAALALNDEELMAMVQRHKSRSSKLKDDRYQTLSMLQSDLEKELSKVGVTRKLLWEEYINSNPGGYSYTQFCRHYKQYNLLQHATMPFKHLQGKTLQLDFAGDKLSYINKDTGEIIYCEVLVGTLPFSSYSVAVVLANQQQQEFVHGINIILKKLGGAPQEIKIDNLKSGVIKPDRYEPEFNNLLLQLSTHYNIHLSAARVRKPKDKASVENTVCQVYRNVHATLRHVNFYSIEQLQEAVMQKMEVFNNKPMQNKNTSRQEQFAIEKIQLQPLPTEPFEVVYSRIAKVKNNCHITLGLDKHEYSVPYQYIGQEVQLQYTTTTVQVYNKRFEKIAHHQRTKKPYDYTTLAAHMPPKHQAYHDSLSNTAQYYLNQASQIGTHTHTYILKLLQSKTIEQQTYESCKGLLRLAKMYTASRLEKACEMVSNEQHIRSYKIAKNILENKMDIRIGDGQYPSPSATSSIVPPIHNNQRGATNYI